MNESKSMSAGDTPKEIPVKDGKIIITSYDITLVGKDNKKDFVIGKKYYNKVWDAMEASEKSGALWEESESDQ